MPILKWFPPQGAPRSFVLYKPVTTVGRALGNDVALPSGQVAETHAQGRIVSVLEGGYNVPILAACVEAHLHALGAEPGTPG